MPLDKFHDLGDQFICNACKERMIADSKTGELAGDESVSEEMFKEAGNHGQCDDCLTQCSDYPDCEYSVE